MSLEIRVEDGGRNTGTFALVDGKQQIGSGGDCSICIPHAEVSAKAATLEVSGGVIFFRNQNEFPIYIGSNPLEPGGVAEWRPGTAIQLTRSIALMLERHGAESLGDSTGDGDAKSQLSSLIQIAVIVVCLVGGALMLMSDGSSTVSEDSSVISFDDLIQQFEQAGGPDLRKLKQEQKMLLTYVTEARSLESRWGTQKKEDALAAYELVLSSRASGQGAAEDTLERLAKEYAASRIDSLE